MYVEGGSLMKAVSTELLDETFQSLEGIARRRNWSIEDTVRIIINEGIASYHTEDKAKSLKPLSDSEKIDKLMRMLIDADSQYASLKFQNFTLLQDNKTYMLNIAGYKGRIEFLEAHVLRLNDEIKQLKTELENEKRLSLTPGNKIQS